MIKNLKIITQKKAGFKISDYNTSKRLSDIVYIETGIEVSYNTLRRFFGIVKSVKPSNHTLNALAIFNGFTDYNDFILNYNLKNRWKQDFEIADLYNQSRTQILNYIDVNLHVKRQFVHKLVQILRELILVRNYTLLNQIFNAPRMAFNEFDFDDVAYFGNCIGPIIKTIDIKSFEAQSLIVNDNFIDLVLCIYVDYNNLSGHYGEFLKLIKNQSKRKDIIQFSKAVLNLNFYLTDKINKLYELNFDSKYHPILQSRIMAQLLFLEPSDCIANLDNYSRNLKFDNKTNIDFYFEIITTALVTQNFEVMAWVSKRFESKTDYNNFYKFEHHEHYTLMLIMLLKYQNDTKQLNLWLKSVSFDNFYRPYSILLMQYVHILKYHLSKIDKDIHKTKYMEVAVSFFPEFFTENYLLNYFKS
jgi:hypothetical protein